MRMFVSKNVGHGVRVGVSGKAPRVTSARGEPAPRYVAAAPKAVRPLLLGCAVTGGVGLVVFPPLLLVTLALFVALLVATTRWNTAKAEAARMNAATGQYPTLPRTRP